MDRLRKTLTKPSHHNTTLQSNLETTGNYLSTQGTLASQCVFFVIFHLKSNYSLQQKSPGRTVLKLENMASTVCPIYDGEM